ncbi:MAG TPA: hypothetical protein VJ246_03440 [Patescibacteria group bacterium]|nr:hypothetical protein [Patescibacteria group bacterium]
MNKKLAYPIVLTLAVFMVVARVQPVRAQEEISLSPPQVEIAKKTYAEQLDVYRVKEQRFMVSREQYKQVQTLASLEEVVKASKEVQTARIDTLLTYFKVLQLTMNELKGAELTKKTVQLERIQAILTELDVARNRIANSNDRIALDNASAAYESRNEAYVSAAYGALTLIRIAHTQTATDQLGLLSAQVFDTITAASPEASVLAEKQRGYDELARTITQIKDFIRQAFTRSEGFDQYLFTAASYAQITDILNSAYAKLKLGENFVKELAK